MQADTAVYINQGFYDTLTCPGDTLFISYNVTNAFRAGNTFTVQMSDASGNFKNPLDINTVSATRGGILKYWIPDTLTPGSGYRIRIVSSNFRDTSYDNGKNIRVSEYPKPKAVAIFPICANGSLQLADTGTAPAATQHRWTGPGGFSIGMRDYIRPNVQITDSGYYVLTADNFSCIVKDSVHVEIYAKPDKPVVQSNSPVCEGDTLKVWATSTTTNVTAWNWLRPSGFASYTTGDTVIPTAALTDTGLYIALAIAGDCPSDADSIRVVVESQTSPTVQISVDPPDFGPWVVLSFKVTGYSNQGKSPTFQWLKNGVSIPGATNTNFFGVTGRDLNDGDVICVSMTSSSQCPEPKVAQSCITMDVDMGIKPMNAIGNVQLYPNPNNGSFTLTGNTAADNVLQFQVHNVLGQVVFEDVIEPVNRQLNKRVNINNLPEGIYMLQLKAGEGFSTLRFIVDR